jgi:DNA adenine methylase
VITHPVLRYFGGKFRLAPWVIAHFPGHRRYVEPFGGSASVLLQKDPAAVEIYNDLDCSVVSFFRVLRDSEQRAELQRLLRLTPYSRDEFVLARDPAGEPVEAARRLCVRSYMGVGTSGLRCRDTGFRGEFKDRHKQSSQMICWRSLPDRLDAVAQRLAGVMLENRDALEVIEMSDDPETLVYCDPPYPFSTRRAGCRKEYAHEMDDSAHERLLSRLKVLKSMAVVSGYPESIYDDLGWESIDHVNYSLGGAKRIERLWMNPPVSARLDREHLFEQSCFDFSA